MLMETFSTFVIKWKLVYKKFINAFIRSQNDKMWHDIFAKKLLLSRMCMHNLGFQFLLYGVKDAILQNIVWN